MRQALRRAVDFAAALSALLCVLTCLLWVLSTTGSVGMTVLTFKYRDGELSRLTLDRGIVAADNKPQNDIDALAAQRYYRERIDVEFEKGHKPLPPPPRSWPAWSHASRWLLPGVAACLALLPLARGTLRARGGRRQRRGLCPSCGYDLRATPEGGGALLGRCPECGRVPGRKGALA